MIGRRREREERGSTLLELMLVTLLATMASLGIVFFYLSSQATWLDGSVQAMSQREATVIVGALTDSLRRASSAVVFDSPDSLHQGISIRDGAGSEFFRMWWNTGDSLVHERVNGGSDLGAVGRSKVETFRFGRADSLVELRLLQVRAANGERIQLATTVNLYNR